MSNFDREAIDRLRTSLRTLCTQYPGGYWTDQIESCLYALDACLDEIKWQAAIIRAAIDEGPGYPCGCSHELDQDGVVIAVHTTCEAHRRAEAQGRRLRESVQAIERLTRGAQGEGNHRLLVQIREAVREALAETEGR